jgi:DUF3047 family protein
MNRCKVLVKVILLFSAQVVCAENAEMIVPGNFSGGSLQGWEQEIFRGKTDYQLESLTDRKVVRAESSNSASGLYKKQRIDLWQTPYISWQWRVEQAIDPSDERLKAGDDYAARVYVVVSGGLAFWRTRAINYVWSAGQAKGAVWSNAYAGDNVKMMSLRDKQDETATWQQEKRNVREDFQRLFGEDVHYIDAIALMTDSDDSKGRAIAYYGDIIFSAE